jgi:hypothetical protein
MRNLRWIAAGVSITLVVSSWMCSPLRYSNILVPLPKIRLQRNPQPSAGIVDSAVGQEHRGRRREERGYDGGKKIKGRKRHLLVDTEDFVLRAKVLTAQR